MAPQTQLIISNRFEEDQEISPMASPLPRPLAAQSPSQQVSFHAPSSPGKRHASSPSIYRKTLSRREPQAEPEPVPSDDETTAILGNEQGGSKSYNAQNPSQASGSDAQRQSSSVRARQKGQVDGPADDGTSDHTLSFWQRLADKYGSIELENKGSVARDHLALERTFLAWLRTSLSFASIGIAITQLFRLNTTINSGTPTESQLRLRHVGKPLGGTFLAVGILTLLIGFHRYFESQHYVIRGQFPASRGSVILMSFVSGALVVASFVLILVFGTNAITPKSP